MQLTPEIKHLKDILDSFLGEPKRELDDSLQLEYPCPCCVEKYGSSEIRKANLSISLSKQRMNCWKCSSEGGDMHGSIIKLIKMYGNESILMDYKATIRSIRESEMYKIHFHNDEFNIDTSVIEKEELQLPSSFQYFNPKGSNNPRALGYLSKRGIGWDIINNYKLGYTEYQDDNKKSGFRIIIPSYDAVGELNYWVGRDYLPSSKMYPRIKYDNPQVEKRNLIFNEEKVQWDADITLVEGPFDHLVVPNSIPLLGKSLTKEFKLYWELITRANANVNIFLDGDAASTVKELYKFLNHGRLYGKIRYIPVGFEDDPSSIYQNYGNKGIIQYLRNAAKINEVYL